MTELLVPIIICLIASLVGMLLREYSLPTVKSLVNAWTRFYTRFAPEDEREIRRDRILSDVHETEVHLRSEGYSRSAIACHILLRLPIGIKDDLGWLAPYLPIATAEILGRWSDGLEAFGAPRIAIAFLATTIFMNFCAAVSNPDELWKELLLANVLMVCAGFYMRYRERPRVQRFSVGFTRLIAVATLFASVFLTGGLFWLVVQYRLYDYPLFYQIPLAMLPIALGTAISIRVC